jgi:ribosomal protein S18 acetylase RimI-like enzyme
MAIEITASTNTALLVSLLEEADEDRERVRHYVELHHAYLAYEDETVIGAAVIDWQPQESEILYIATVPNYRGRGYGKQMMAAILAMARERGVSSVLVGTGNSGLDQIAFYQKCGFRIDSVRKDYFDYFAESVYENGIRFRDMLVLRHNLTPE